MPGATAGQVSLALVLRWRELPEERKAYYGEVAEQGKPATRRNLLNTRLWYENTSA